MEYETAASCASALLHSWISRFGLPEMYKEIKQVHKPEAYLTVNINKKVHTSVTKFRLGSHKLLVERGRWTISKFDYKLRKCTYVIVVI